MIHIKADHAIAEAVTTAAKRAAFMSWFGLPSVGGWRGLYLVDLLCQLHQAQGECLSAADLGAHLGCSPNAIFVRICRLRNCMNSEAIDFVKGHGYRLTEVGMDEVKDAMHAMARSLVA